LAQQHVSQVAVVDEALGEREFRAPIGESSVRLRHDADAWSDYTAERDEWVAPRVGVAPGTIGPAKPHVDVARTASGRVRGPARPSARDRGRWDAEPCTHGHETFLRRM